ncbi:hypothetical protein ABQX22_14170 [Xanthomonas sp. WHRI 1810A]|uniref:hypothetical protein n=1 Tax=Xanthomonas sp. WHRI 1810A TaxID=3161565 RepID=UPI0032E85F98
MSDDRTNDYRSPESILSAIDTLNLPAHVAGEAALCMHQIQTSTSLLDLALSLAYSTGLVRGLGFAGAIGAVQEQGLSALFKAAHSARVNDLRNA